MLSHYPADVVHKFFDSKNFNGVFQNFVEKEKMPLTNGFITGLDQTQSQSSKVGAYWEFLYIYKDRETGNADSNLSVG